MSTIDEAVSGKAEECYKPLPFVLPKNSELMFDDEVEDERSRNMINNALLTDYELVKIIEDARCFAKEGKSEVRYLEHELTNGDGRKIVTSLSKRYQFTAEDVMLPEDIEKMMKLSEEKRNYIISQQMKYSAMVFEDRIQAAAKILALPQNTIDIDRKDEFVYFREGMLHKDQAIRILRLVEVADKIPLGRLPLDPDAYFLHSDAKV